MERVGLADTFAECGPYADLLDKYSLSAGAIADAVRRVLKRKDSTRIYKQYSKEIQNA
jgi:UDP:flavonoid glycosyltransferase YjiC (YdhE family)